jgi:formylglycine-generating enzyme required for sulfatase activity
VKQVGKFRFVWVFVSVTLLGGSFSAAARSAMVDIPSGSFLRSDGREVSVKSFSLLNTEVTWSQYKTVRDWAEQHGYAFEEGIGQADRPAQNICWYDAVKWCNALSEMSGKTPVYQPGGRVYRRGRVDLLNADVVWSANGYRLPTEAEWEYAYRAGTTTCFYWGDYSRNDPANTDYTAFHFWGSDEIDGGPLPVASKKPNAFGLYDMAGNVEEWVWDRYAIDYAGVGTDNPRGPDRGYWRVMRGGGFVIDRLFSADTRHPSYPFWINTDTGFRIASSDPQADAKRLAGIEPLLLRPNDIEPFTEPLVLNDVRESSDKASCERLFPLLDLQHPNLVNVRAAYEKQDYSAALTALRDLLVPRLKASHLELYQATHVNRETADKWLAIYREGRPIRWVGSQTDLPDLWAFHVETELAKAWVKWPEITEYADAFFWMLEKVCLTAKPTWNRLSIAEKGSRGKPRDSFYTFIGFDAGHPLRPFACIVWMLQHDFPEADVPPRVLADALFYAATDRLGAGLQDDRGFVPNQVWGNAITILRFGQLFPELKDSAELVAEGAHRIQKSMGTVMADGTDLEASLNYNKTLFEHQDTLNRLFPEKEKRPDWLVKLNHLADYRYYMHAALASPLATYPGIGNQQPTDLRARAQLKHYLADGRLAGMENAMAHLLAPAKGATDKLPEPAFSSVALPYGGYYVERSGWGHDDLYLFMRSSRDGVGHEHRDNNNIQVAAYGAWLLVDSGAPAYWPGHLPDHQKKYIHYFNETGIGRLFHANSLSVDGLEQGVPSERLFDATSGWTSPRKTLFHHSARFDLAEGIFDGWYQSEEPISDKNLKDLVEDHGLDEVADIVAYNTRLKREGARKLRAKHRRLALFLRDEKFWVLVDEVEGGGEYIQTWNFPPIDRGLNTARYFLEPSDEDLQYGKPISDGYTPSEVRSDAGARRIVTISRSRPNIGILNFTAAPVRYRQHYGDLFPMRGWQAFGIVGEKVPAVQMEGAWFGDAPMVTALYPMASRPANAITLDAGLEGFADCSSGQVSGFDFKSDTSLTGVRASRDVRELVCDSVSATATLLLVRKHPAGLDGIALGCSQIAVDGTARHVEGKNFEFSLVNGEWRTKPIRAAETFQWQDNGKGQLVPRYE